MTALNPLNSIMRFTVVAVALGVCNAHAADSHSEPPHGVAKKADHDAAKKPLVLKPGQSKKMDHPVAGTGSKATPTPVMKRTASKPKPTAKTSVKKAAEKVGKKAGAAKTTNKMKTKSWKPKARRVAKSAHSVHWGYQGAGGPSHWGSLKQAYKSCSQGRNQSPVDIESAESATLAPLSLHYKVSLIEMINNGHTVQANYGKGSYITLGTERYDLLQFHFHTPSEHRIAGRSFPMEIHFVHRNKRGQLAVVGVLATFGDYNLAAREIWDRLPARAHTKSADTRALINARDLMPDNTKYFRYSGSLTTPPCSEKVTWMVLQTPVTFSKAQIARLHRIIGMNARPAQARNSRYLLQSVGG